MPRWTYPRGSTRRRTRNQPQRQQAESAFAQAFAHIDISAAEPRIGIGNVEENKTEENIDQVAAPPGETTVLPVPPPAEMAPPEQQDHEENAMHWELVEHLNGDDDHEDGRGGGPNEEQQEAPPAPIEPHDVDQNTEANNNEATNEITLDAVQDGVVSNNTKRHYMSDNIKFLRWCKENHPDWLNATASEELDFIWFRRQGERQRDYNTRTRREIQALLRNASEQPVVVLDSITPLGFMEYVMGRRRVLNNNNTGATQGGYLSKSAYSNIRAALFHLFRLHNKSGFPEQFRLELGNLYRGFYRELTRQRRQLQPIRAEQQEGQAQIEEGGNAAIRNTHGVKEGKDPMSVELYKHICRWLLDWGTIDGVFAHCFLVLTWNLSCRASNTGNIRFSEIEWSSTFDAFEIYFAHMKTDQTGSEAKYLRHLYANPHCPLVCPVFALAMYFSCCFNTQQLPDNYLFPGEDQYQRFSEQLGRVLEEHRDEVTLMGADPSEIGTHSIRKGAVTYMASLPGGPTLSAVCIRAGWTMGTVRDIYMRYLSSGDQFVGRCLSLLPILRMEFGCSPPYFIQAWEEWGDTFRKQQFPMVSAIVHLHRLTLMCMASLAYHRRFVLDTMHVNHVVRLTGALHRNEAALALLDNENDNPPVVVTYPWSAAGHVYTGIPPHVAVLEELQVLKNQQRTLIDSFIENVKTAIDECGLAGGALSEQRLRTIFNDFSDELRQQFSAAGGGNNNGQGPNQQGGGTGHQVEDERGRVYRWHYFDGQFHRVPKDWRFPRVGVLDIWKHWWIGDLVRGIPPLRMVKPEDLKFLDGIPLGEDEMHARVGRDRHRRRPARKIYCDLKFLMEYITKKIRDAGRMNDVITMESVVEMYQVVAQEFEGGRNAQKKWVTVATELRARLRQQSNT